MSTTQEAVERYTIRRKILVLFGASFQIFDAHQKPVGFCRQKAFKLREDIRIYTDDSRSEELLAIKARNIIDFGATFDVSLPDGTVLGSLRRKGLKSLLRDNWLVFDPSGVQIGTILEDSTGLALVRRLLPLGNIFFPERFHLADMSGRSLATFRQHFNLIVYRLGIAVHADDHAIDDLLILAAGSLLAAVEGRQGGDRGGLFDALAGP